MGKVQTTVEVRESAKAKKRFSALFLVDTGCDETYIPAEELRKIGIVPLGKEINELADGSEVEYEC